MRKISVMILLMALINSAYSQSGKVEGVIVSHTLEFLPGVSVSLVNSSRSTTTNEEGQFSFSNLRAGTYTMSASSIGYTVLKQNILVEEGKTTRLQLQLSADRQQLNEVVVSGTRSGYKTQASPAFLRGSVKLLDLPQSAQVIPKQVLRDRNAVTLNEAGAVMTGVKANNGMGAFAMRGFTGYNHFDGGFITVNGIRGNMFAWSQQPLLYNIESIEVLRGPASVLFSEGIPGGVINMNTKKAQAERRYELDLSYGSWNFFRVAADATGALSKDKKLMYRLIAGYDRSNSFRDQQKTDNIFIAPSLAYQFNKSSRIDLDLVYNKANAVHQYDRGTYIRPVVGGGYDFDYYSNKLTVQSPSDFGNTENISANLHYSKLVSKDFSFNLVSRYVQSDMFFADHGVVGAIRNDSISRSYQVWDYQQYSWQNTAYANYLLKTGKIENSLLAGVDFNNYGWRKNDYRNSPSTRVSILNPDYSNDVPGVDPSVDYYDDNKQRNHVFGAYLQDQLSLGERIKLMLSIRYDNYAMKQTPLSARDDLQGDASYASAWTPRAGIVYQPVSNISFYGSVNRSFNPQVSNSAGAGGPFPPRKAEQFEIGYKGDFFNNALSTSIALYHINYKNILAADPTPQNPNRRVAVDGTESKGFDITIQGKLKDLSVIAGYAYNDHRLTSDNTLGKKGYRYINAPNHIANLWLKYTLSMGRLKGLGLGIGGRYTSDQVGNLATQDFVLPSSMVLDLAANYSFRRYNFQFNLYNFTNERYFQGGLSRVTIASLGNPLNARFSVNYLIN